MKPDFVNVVSLLVDKLGPATGMNRLRSDAVHPMRDALERILDGMDPASAGMEVLGEQVLHKHESYFSNPSREHGPELITVVAKRRYFFDPVSFIYESAKSLEKPEIPAYEHLRTEERSLLGQLDLKNGVLWQNFAREGNLAAGIQHHVRTQSALREKLAELIFETVEAYDAHYSLIPDPLRRDPN